MRELIILAVSHRLTLLNSGRRYGALGSLLSLRMNDGELVDSNPSSMRIKEIRQELESMGIVTKSFIEKSESTL